MGHTIQVLTVDKREQIIPAVVEFAYVNVDRGENREGSYHGNMTIHDDLIYDTYEEACKALKNLDQGFYDDHAVQYHPTKPYEKSKRLCDLEGRVHKMVQDQIDYRNAHAVQERSAKLISCKFCGSKIAKDHLQGQICPVCGHDLRADYVLQKLNWYNERIDRLDMQIEEEERRLEKKSIDKSKTRWAVKVEVHS